VITIAAGIALLPPLIGWLAGLGAFGPLFETWIYRALVLLVIACPCALVISTPVTIVSAIASAARAGVLVKGGAHLESLGSLRVIAFDKTGTLTAGKPEVVDVRCLDHEPALAWHECDDCRHTLASAAAVERRSEHPLARAVVRAAELQGLIEALPAAKEMQALTGRGVQGRVDGHTVTVGTHSYIHQENPELVESPLCQAVHAAQATGQTAMVVRDDCCGVLGYIAVADTLRAEVPAVISALEGVGIEQTVMLAMGAAGTDTALETADVALMADDLGKLPFAVRLSRRSRAIIRQNVALSLGIKAVFMVLALAGVATLWMAVFADMGASLLVTFNGMRLLRQK
jgi:Cd2+/Zn2+-exporting ATPase